MIIEIHRNNYSKHGVEGTLIVNSKVIGATVEHPRHYVPAGPYPIELERSKKFGCLMPTLPCGATIQPGNGPFNLADGSIIVGEKYIEGVVLSSSAVFEALAERIGRSRKKKPVVLILIND